MFKKSWIIVFSLPLFALITSCDSGDKQKNKNKPQIIKENPSQQSIVDQEIVFKAQPEELTKPRFPDQHEFDSSRHDFIIMNLSDEPISFKEPMSFNFKRERSFIGFSSIYTLEKIFIGFKDNSRFLFIGENDDVQLDTNWESVYIDMSKYYVYAKNKAGDEVFIGFVHTEGARFRIELFAPYDLDIENQIITLNSPAVEVAEEISTCPRAIELISDMACRGYIAIYNTLTSIDFKSMGKAGPDIAKKVINPKTVIKIVKGFLGFKISVPKVRDEFIIPIFKTVRQLKRLKEYRGLEEEIYLEQTATAYSDLIITSIDSIAKIQKMVPESFKDIENIALVGAILMMSPDTTNPDKPKWFKDIVMPVVGEFGALSLELIYNSSRTDLESRIENFIDLEEKLNTAAVKLCKHGNSVEEERKCIAELQ